MYFLYILLCNTISLLKIYIYTTYKFHISLPTIIILCYYNLSRPINEITRTRKDLSKDTEKTHRKLFVIIISRLDILVNFTLYNIIRLLLINNFYTIF